MRLILSLRPKFCKFGLFFQNLWNVAAVDQPLIRKCRRAFYSVGDFARRFFHQSKTTAFDVEHVLEPRCGPTADGDVAADLRLSGLRFRNQRRESAAVAAAENVHAGGDVELKRDKR